MTTTLRLMPGPFPCTTLAPLASFGEDGQYLTGFSKTANGPLRAHLRCILAPFEEGQTHEEGHRRWPMNIFINHYIYQLHNTKMAKIASALRMPPVVGPSGLPHQER